MEIISTKPIVVTCDCGTMSKTNNLDDFKEVRNTLPPTIYFTCPDCKSNNILRKYPKRLEIHLVNKILKERGIFN